jgi:zinc transporter
MSIYEKLAQTDSFVFGFALDGLGGGLPLDKSVSEDKHVWCHLDFMRDDCRSNLEKLRIPEHAIDALTRLDTRPRTLVYESGILLILRVVNLNPGQDPNDMVSLRFWIEKDRVISLRHRRVLSTQDVKEEINQGAGPKNSSELLTTIIEHIADRIADYVDAMEARMLQFEEGAMIDNIVKTRADVSNLRREAAMVRRYLAPQREALEALHRLGAAILEKAELLYIQELSDRITRYVEDLDLVREKAIVLQEELMNMMAQQQNERMYVLSIVAAIFLPISFVTGLFGMNVAGLPGVETPEGFLYVFSGMVVVVIVILALFKLKKWL